jgi:hypothetical protein
MELLRHHLEERPTAERSPTQLGEAVGLSRATIWRQLRQPSTSSEDELELRSQIQAIALEMRSYGYRPITAELHRRYTSLICSKTQTSLLPPLAPFAYPTS